MVGQSVKFRRLMLGMSQHELGQRCQISAQQVHKYEQGHSGMRASRLVQFALILGVPVRFFFENVETSSDFPDDLVAVLSNRKNAEMILLFHGIQDNAVQDSILEMARAYHRIHAPSSPSTILSVKTETTDR
jgi:transcriptional regulator with XRE-family HTH domain